MKIETKFNINDEVWYIDNFQKAKSGKVNDIKIIVSSQEIKKAGDRRDLLPTGEFKEKATKIIYKIHNRFQMEIERTEQQVFANKEELIMEL